MASSDTTLSYNEFIAFLLIYTSHVDLEFDQDEKFYIKEKVGDEIYSKMLDLYLNNGEYQNLKLIMDHKESHYPTREKKKEMMEIIEQSFYADGEYSKLEKNLLNFLDHLL